MLVNTDRLRTAPHLLKTAPHLLVRLRGCFGPASRPLGSHSCIGDGSSSGRTHRGPQHRSHRHTVSRTTCADVPGTVLLPADTHDIKTRKEEPSALRILPSEGKVERGLFSSPSPPVRCCVCEAMKPQVRSESRAGTTPCRAAPAGKSRKFTAGCLTAAGFVHENKNMEMRSRSQEVPRCPIC